MFFIQHYVDLNTPYVDLNAEELKNKNDYLQMMTAPDHENLVSLSVDHEYVNAPTRISDSAYLSMNSGSPREDEQLSQAKGDSFRFPNNNHSDSDEAVESAPMLSKSGRSPDNVENLDDDNYLRPIDVKKKREEFVRKREEEKRLGKDMLPDRDSGYCNTVKLGELIEIKNIVNPKSAGYDAVDGATTKNKFSRVQGNYVNVPEQIIDDSVPSSFMNPSYVFVEGKKTDTKPMP